MRKCIIVSVLTLLTGLVSGCNDVIVEPVTDDLTNSSSDNTSGAPGNTGDTIDDSNDKVDDSGENSRDAPSDIAPELQKLVNNVIMTRHYTLAGHTKLNTKPYPSDVSAERVVDVYIDDDNLASYKEIAPNASGSFMEVEQGASIIREVWTENHELEKYTVMIKMENGYFPEGGDFLYATVQLDGTISQSGALETCGNCHNGRSNDGYLFGVYPEHQGSADDTAEDADARLASLAKSVISDKLHLTDDYQKMNEDAYRTDLNDSDYINVYISKFALPNYLLIVPDATGSEAAVPENTVIVREVKDGSGNLLKYTVMIKGPSGYFDGGGDFYYGVFDTEGEIVVNDGVELQGRLENCGDCHVSARSNDDFLYGVYEDVRISGLSVTSVN